MKALTRKKKRQMISIKATSNNNKGRKLNKLKNCNSSSKRSTLTQHGSIIPKESQKHHRTTDLVKDQSKEPSKGPSRGREGTIGMISNSYSNSNMNKKSQWNNKFRDKIETSLMI